MSRQLPQDFALYAVTGKPVLHSRSPQMMNAAFGCHNKRAFYLRLGAQSAAHALNAAKELQIRGLNVTSPFKEDMFRLASAASPAASELSSINSIVLSPNGDMQGFNTDVDGVRACFKNHGVSLNGKRAVILGAGGAARAAAQALLASGAHVTLANRTFEKAESIAQKMAVHAISLSDPKLPGIFKEAEILVSCLATTDRVVSKSFLHPNLTVLDAVYGKSTALSEDAASQGCRVIPGIEWLLHQGSLAFETFTGMPAPIQSMKEALSLDSWPKQHRRVALIGFMGSGKSTVASELSRLVGLPFLSLDSEIEKRSGQSIRKLFQARGETYFRDLESRILAEFAENTGGILACGGGVVVQPQNRALLREHFISIWLSTSLQTALARCPNDGTRPLLTNAGDIEAASRLFVERFPYYAECSDLVISTEELPPAAAATLISEELKAIW